MCAERACAALKNVLSFKEMKIYVGEKVNTIITSLYTPGVSRPTTRTAPSTRDK